MEWVPKPSAQMENCTIRQVMASQERHCKTEHVRVKEKQRDYLRKSGRLLQLAAVQEFQYLNKDNANGKTEKKN